MAFGHTRDEVPPEPVSPRRGPLFNLLYSGYCRECGSDMDEGDKAGYVDGDLLCEDCWREAG